MTITLEIPDPLLQRLYRSEDFIAWSHGKPAGTRRPIEELILGELEGYCEAVEADIVTDDEGFFIADKLHLWTELMKPEADGEGN